MLVFRFTSNISWRLIEFKLQWIFFLIVAVNTPNQIPLHNVDIMKINSHTFRQKFREINVLQKKLHKIFDYVHYITLKILKF